ncbi:hypothetical protein OS21_27340 [Dickeya oryzae]
MQLISRDGVTQPWGNTNAEITRTSYQEKINLEQTPTFRLKLERTNDGFITAYAPKGSDQWVSKTIKGADLVTQQDKSHYYVGFFASRNAKITISNASLTTSPANTKPSAPFKAETTAPLLQVASSSLSTSDTYPVQARVNYNGTIEVFQNGKSLGKPQHVRAGDYFSLTTRLTQPKSEFKLVYMPEEGEDKTAKDTSFSVEKNYAGRRQKICMSPRKVKLATMVAKTHHWILKQPLMRYLLAAQYG